MPNPHQFHTSQSSYTTDDLLKSSHEGYFGPGNAQLPAPPMLSVDSGEFGKGRAIGVGEVKFRGHFTPKVRRVRYEVHMRPADLAATGH